MKYKFEFDDSEENFNKKQLQRYLRIDDLVRVILEVQYLINSYDGDIKLKSISKVDLVDTFYEILGKNNIDLDEVNFD